MSRQTVTGTAESDCAPTAFYSVLAEANNIPKWASAFADSITRVDDTHHTITKSSVAFEMEVVANESAVTVDYIRQLPSGKRGGAYIRVMPRPAGGSVITMTLPIGPNANEPDITKVLEQELLDLIQLVQSSSGNSIKANPLTEVGTS